jgi:hypothetical protein
MFFFHKHGVLGWIKRRPLSTFKKMIFYPQTWASNNATMMSQSKHTIEKYYYGHLLCEKLFHFHLQLPIKKFTINSKT